MLLLFSVLISSTFILLGIGYQTRKMVRASRIFITIGFLFIIVILSLDAFAVYHDYRYYPRFQDKERVLGCKVDPLFIAGMWILILAALYSFVKGNNRMVKLILSGGFILAAISAVIDLGILNFF